MIRIKCPKCAAPLALDDDEAGGVGECTECGAKFRVPQAKAKVPARAHRAEDDDEDEDEEDEQDEREEARAARRRRSRRDLEKEDEDEEPVQPRPRKAGSVVGTLITLGIMLAVIVVMGIAGIFLKKIGVVVFFASVLAALLCAVMVVRAATKEGGTLAFVCVVIALLMTVNGIGVTCAFFNLMFESGLTYPLSLAVFFGPLFWSAFLGIHCASNWKDNGRFAQVWLFCVIMAGVAFVATNLNQARIDAYRQQVKARLQITMVLPSPAGSHDAQRG